jgi:hypothetical protein
VSADDDAMWSFLGSAKAASDRHADRGFQDGPYRGGGRPLHGDDGGGSGGSVGLSKVFFFLLIAAIAVKIGGTLALLIGGLWLAYHVIRFVYRLLTWA